MKRCLWLPWFAAACAVALASVVACEDGSPPPPCVNSVPPGGCPTDADADVCSDPTCSTVYDCENGSWVLVQTCGPHPDAGGAPTDAGHEAATASDASIDAPPGAFGGPGCVDLEMPDCPVGTALACGSAIDCCGCQDLYVCQNGGWVPWGECADGGVVQN